MLEIIKPGSRVIVGKQDARVMQAAIQTSDNIVYQVVWWKDGIRNVQWVEAFEVETCDDASSMRIGFREAVRASR